MSTTAQINDSLQVGNSVLRNIGSFAPLHKNRVEQAGFAVLKAPDIPSILIETAFISNPQEEKKLNDATYQERIADAILTGIKEYFAKNPPVKGIPARDKKKIVNAAAVIGSFFPNPLKPSNV